MWKIRPPMLETFETDEDGKTIKVIKREEVESDGDKSESTESE